MENREDFRYPVTGGSWHEEAIEGLTRSRVSYGWLGVHTLLSLVGTKMEVGTKITEVVSY